MPHAYSEHYNTGYEEQYDVIKAESRGEVFFPVEPDDESAKESRYQ